MRETKAGVDLESWGAGLGEMHSSSLLTLSGSFQRGGRGTIKISLVPLEGKVESCVNVFEAKRHGGDGRITNTPAEVYMPAFLRPNPLFWFIVP